LEDQRKTFNEDGVNWAFFEEKRMILSYLLQRVTFSGDQPIFHEKRFCVSYAQE
jgi:hypothetical protein